MQAFYLLFFLKTTHNNILYLELSVWYFSELQTCRVTETSHGFYIRNTNLWQEEHEEEEEIEDVYVPYTPPVAKPWQSLGSEVDISEETVVESRKKVDISVEVLLTCLFLAAWFCKIVFYMYILCHNNWCIVFDIFIPT